jgi:phytoene dehydrogenase-like protein
MTGKGVMIVGAGMAGLACAARLAESGVTPVVLEAGDGVGGRIRTDALEGFLLDRGFQVLLTAYPEAQRAFDYGLLDLKRFEPGALVYHDGRFHRVSDPWRRPRHAFATLFSPVGSLADKLRVVTTRRRACAGSLGSLFEREQIPTIDYLRDAGFSERMIERFLRPFLGGIFLESSLATASGIFEFVFRMFGLGDAALPARGMGALARQLAERLPTGSIRLHTPVREIDADGVVLEDGDRVPAAAVVVATDARSAARLCGWKAPAPGGAVTCLYFATPEAPIDEAILVLNGTGQGPVNNLCVPSQVSADYAPRDRALVSVSVIGTPGTDNAALESDVRAQLGSWFGNAVRNWRVLRTYRIPHALPAQTPEAMRTMPRDPRIGPRRYVCGDHCVAGSLQAALASGRRAAEAVLDDL